MSDEAILQRTVLRALRAAGAHAQKHADRTPGVPDISFALPGAGEGWIELKVVRLKREWNFTNLTPHKVGLTSHQLLWLRQRRAAGGHTWLLVALSHQWWLWQHLPARLDESFHNPPRITDEHNLHLHLGESTL